MKQTDAIPSTAGLNAQSTGKSDADTLGAGFPAVAPAIVDNANGPEQDRISQDTQGPTPAAANSSDASLTPGRSTIASTAPASDTVSNQKTVPATSALPVDQSGLIETGGLPDDPSQQRSLMQFEMELSDKVLTYILDATRGRIDPNRISGYHALFPGLADIFRQRFTGGHAEAQSCRTVLRRAFRLRKHCGIKGRNSEKDRRLVPLQNVEDGLWRRPIRQQDRRGTGGHRHGHDQS